MTDLLKWLPRLADVLPALENAFDSVGKEDDELQAALTLMRAVKDRLALEKIQGG